MNLKLHSENGGGGGAASLLLLTQVVTMLTNWWPERSLSEWERLIFLSFFWLLFCCNSYVIDRYLSVLMRVIEFQIVNLVGG